MYDKLESHWLRVAGAHFLNFNLFGLKNHRISRVDPQNAKKTAQYL